MQLRLFRSGLLLALSAWLMQLSVFLTPILSKDIGIGHGVCVELAAIATVTQTTNTTAMMPDDMSMHDMSMHDMRGMSMQQSPANQTIITLLNSTKENLPTPHHNHVLCDFCLLFGHSVLPPEILLLLLILLLSATMPIQQPFSFLSQLKITNKKLRPQGRAPPVLVFA